MTKTLTYIVLLSIVALIVAASGCSSTNNNTAPTPAQTPTIQATPSETPTLVTPVTPVTPESTPVTPTPVTAPTTNENITPITPAPTPATNETPTTGNSYVVNGTHIGTAQRNIIIAQNRQGTSTVSNTTNATIIAIPSETMPYTPIVPTNTKATNPFNTTGNNVPIVQNTGQAQIIPANQSTPSTGNATVNIGTAQRNAQRIIAAQQAAQGNTTTTTTTTTQTMTVNVSPNGTVSVSNDTGNQSVTATNY